MKKIAFALIAVSAVVFAFAANQNAPTKADGCCAKEAKVVVKNEKDCEGGVCKPAVQVKVEGKEGCCATKAKAVQVKMESKEACCTSTAKAPVAKAGKGCCNATGEMAKYKVFADGKWMFFGCKDSAEKGRRDLTTMAFKVGKVMPVTSMIRIPANQSLI